MPPRTDRERLLVAVSSVADVYNRGLSDVSLRLYAEALSAWPVEAVEGCMLEMLRACRWFPSVAEWGEHAAEWWRGRQAVLREERLRARALTEQGSMSDREREQQAQAAKAMRDELAHKLGWR